MLKAKEFLQNYIAHRAAQLPAEVRLQFKPEWQMEMELSGSGGGLFTIAWEKGNCLLREGPASTPLVRLATTAQGFLDLMTGQYSEFVDFTRMDASTQFVADPLTALSPKKVDIVRKLRGTLLIQYCDGSIPNDDILSEAFMSFNGEAIDRTEPRCTVVVPIGKLERIAKGEVTPPQLMMAGGMRVTGDMQMIIQMSPLLR